LIDALISAKALPSDLRDRIKKILADARALNSARNQVIHSEYSYESPDVDMPWFWWRKLRDRPESDKEHPVLHHGPFTAIEIDFLERLVMDARDLSDRILSLSEEIRIALKPK
jgi:hypothetical protein